MVENGARNMQDVAETGFQIALEMARGESVNQIGEPIEREQPGKEQMPAPPLGKRAVAGQRDPPGKSAPARNPSWSVKTPSTPVVLNVMLPILVQPMGGPSSCSS